MRSITAARAATLGKNVGDDFREGKITLPVVLSFRRGSRQGTRLLETGARTGRRSRTAISKRPSRSCAATARSKTRRARAPLRRHGPRRARALPRRPDETGASRRGRVLHRARILSATARPSLRGARLRAPHSVARSALFPRPCGEGQGAGCLRFIGPGSCYDPHVQLLPASAGEPVPHRGMTGPKLAQLARRGMIGPEQPRRRYSLPLRGGYGEGARGTIAEPAPQTHLKVAHAGEESALSNGAPPG